MISLGSLRPVRIMAAVILAGTLVAPPALAQVFDNFEESTLPPLPDDDALIPLPGSDALNPPWLDGEGTLLQDGTSGDIMLRDGAAPSGVFLRPGVGSGAAVTSVSQPPAETGDTVVLRALDRMLGRPTDLEMEVGQTVLFGRIAIHVPECRFPADDPASDAYAHLQVLDTGGNMLFDGWMVASSPALSALEHPRYDVWVLRCASTS